MTQAIVIGDWSDDGHGKTENFFFTSNKTDDEIRQAFLESCDLTGYSFDTNDPLPNGKQPKARLVNDYEDSTISAEILADLATFGDIETFLERTENVHEEGEDIDLCPKDCFWLIIWFIKLSLPDLTCDMTKMPPFINGYWGPLNQSWGYGIFC